MNSPTTLARHTRQWLAENPMLQITAHEVEVGEAQALSGPDAARQALRSVKTMTDTVAAILYHS
jgi:hypothetical protein